MAQMIPAPNSCSWNRNHLNFPNTAKIFEGMGGGADKALTMANIYFLSETIFRRMLWFYA